MEQFLSSSNMHRRVFVKGIGFVSLGLLLGTLGGCEDWFKAIKNRPVRRRLRTGSAEVDADIATYRQAVQLMKNLSTQNANDKRGWTYQAWIHGTAGVGFNFCHHGTQHFFSWHRAYLYQFEKICQKLTNKPKFGLPYWNWNQNPDIHPDYLDTNSALFLSRTRTTVNVPWNDFTTDAALNPIFDDTNFFSFSSQIEGTPHNSVHGVVGGTMGGAGSARDPIFWNHHCMVDYCWAKWNIDLGNDNTNDQSWLNTSWNHFVDTDGNLQTIGAALTTIMPLISYRYESSAIGDSPAVADIQNKNDFKKLREKVEKGAPIKFDIKRRINISDTAMITIARPFNKEVAAQPSEFSDIINNDKTKEQIFASIEYAQLPPSSDFFVRVFINMPKADSTTSVKDPHYAGSFAFFGTAPETATQPTHDTDHKHQPKFLVNITQTLQRLKQQQELTDKAPISVQLVAVPFGGQFEKMDTQLRLNKIELIVTPVIVKSTQD